MATLAQATAGAAGGGEAAHLTVLVHWLDDPVDAWVTADGLVLGVDQDDLKVLVGRVLVHPVRVEDSQVAAPPSNALLSNRAKVAGKLQLVDAMVLGLSVHDTLAVLALAATTTHGNTVDDKAWLGGKAGEDRMQFGRRVRRCFVV